MRQVGLFDAETLVGGASDQSLHSAATTNTVTFYPDFYSWLELATHCVAEEIDPSSLWWVEDRNTARSPKAHSKRGASRLPAEYQQSAQAACCHSNEDKWTLLYSILWRLNHAEPQLLELAGDPEIALMQKYAKAVSRDVHKMKAFVRFRKVEGAPPRYVSWFEPQHLIVEYAAPFFQRRFANMHWSILTPVGCAHWDPAGELWFSDPVSKDFAPDGDQFEEAWRVYYKSIFNPARLKVTAMQSEMPKKYWKNMPEAAEIPALVQAAESRTRQMISQHKQEDTMRCGARPEHPDALVHKQLHQVADSSLDQLRLHASLCSQCPQGEPATQTVFGEGTEDARIMVVGEQPGDQEDLQGKPFVGPAGQVLGAALRRAGIEREQCYLTNAVKHFGFHSRGKQRLHKRPAQTVVAACGHWLQREIEIVKPEIIIYLGVTAASTRFGQQVRVQRDRGKLITADGRQHLITAHPSSILRLERGAAQQKAYVQFVEDLMLCANELAVVGDN